MDGVRRTARNLSWPNAGLGKIPHLSGLQEIRDGHRYDGFTIMPQAIRGGAALLVSVAVA